jgi:hypothetical protein
MMPVMDGYTFRRRQLADPRLASIPTFVLTAGKIDQRLLDLSVTGWLRKPLYLDGLLAAIRRCGGSAWSFDHLVHFYDSDDKLAEKVAPFLEDGLASGEAAVLIATPSHTRDVRSALRACALDVEALEACGRLTCLDAAETLAQFSNGKVADETRFAKVVGGVLERARAAAPRGTIRAYGEMVDLLWGQGDVAGAVRLESMWNELARTTRLSLLCSYTAHPSHGRDEAFEEVRGQHSAAI